MSGVACRDIVMAAAGGGRRAAALDRKGGKSIVVACMTTKNIPRIDASRRLQTLGFTDYEARAYVALLEAGEASGYALAKASGMPRANIYAVLEKLAERGAVLRRQGQGGTTWTAVPPDTLLGSLGQQHKRSLDAAAQALAGLTRNHLSTAVFNVRGDELPERARQLVDAARGELLVAIQPEEASVLAGALREARERGVAITTLCLEACGKPCGGCQGELHRRPLAPVDGTRWLVLVADHRHALIGQWQHAVAEGVATAHPLVVELAAAYIRQSLTLAMLGDELAGRFEGLLSGQARQWLEALLSGRGKVSAAER